jgi:hypothetical protein
VSGKLASLLDQLKDADVRRLAWAIGSASLFDAGRTEWQGRLRDDTWAAAELDRCSDWLTALDGQPQPLAAALGDPLAHTPLGHLFEKLVLFWQAARPDVRASTRGLIVRAGGRTLGEYDVVMLRHDDVIETLEVTVKYYLNIKPELGIEGCIGPRAFDRMTDKYSKMSTRQTDLGNTEAGRLAICRWLETTCAEIRTPDQLVVENYALARGYVFHPSPTAAVPIELSPAHGRGLWQTDLIALPEGNWRNLSSREWLGPYRGPVEEGGLPNDPAMPRMYAQLKQQEQLWDEIERRFVVRAEAGLLKSV